MAKRISQLTQLTAAQVATGDQLAIVDVSAGQTKYITVKDLTGAPEFAWVATGESWSFSSWTAATKIGVINVPSDATTKYNAGMWVKFSQTTGGTKVGQIIAVTTTTLSVFFPTATFTNETVTAPVYSPLFAPLGSVPGPRVWQDANGWSVRDHGTYKQYLKRYTFSQSIGGLASLSITPSNGIATTSLPVGMSTISTNYLTYSYDVGGSAGILLIVFEGSTSSAAMNFTTARTDGAGAAVQAGFIDVILTTP